jgi:hypothetical protein
MLLLSKNQNADLNFVAITALSCFCGKCSGGGGGGGGGGESYSATLNNIAPHPIRPRFLRLCMLKQMSHLLFDILHIVGTPIPRIYPLKQEFC